MNIVVLYLRVRSCHGAIITVAHNHYTLGLYMFTLLGIHCDNSLQTAWQVKVKNQYVQLVFHLDLKPQPKLKLFRSREGLSEFC